MVAILVIVVGGMLVLLRWISSLEDGQAESGNVSIEAETASPDWRMQTEAEKAALTQQLSDPSLKKTERAELEEQRDIAEYRLKEDAAPYGEFDREQMIMDSSGIGQIAILFSVIMAAGIVATEFSEGTIKMLLARPVKRWKVLTSKYAASILFGALLMLVGFAVSVVLSYLLFPSGDGAELAVKGGNVVEVSIWGRAIYYLALSFVTVIVYTTFAFMVGSVFRSGALAIGLSLFIYFMGGTVSMLLSKYAIAKYLFFSHELVSQAQGMTLIEGMTMPFSATVLAVYTILFLVVSYFIFTQRDIKA